MRTFENCTFVVYASKDFDVFFYDIARNKEEETDCIDDIVFRAGCDKKDVKVLNHDEFRALSAKKEKAEPRNRQRKYNAFVDAKISKTRKELQFIAALPELLQQFDGKVVNVKLNNAIHEATGFTIEFEDDKIEATYYGSEFDYNNRPSVTHYYPYKGNEYIIRKGFRLEADKVTDLSKEDGERNNLIQELEESKKDFAKYIKEAQKIENAKKALQNKYSFYLRDYCKGQHYISKCID